MRPGIQPVADLGQIAVELRILHRAQILRKLFGRHLPVYVLLFILRHADQDRTAADRRRGAAGKRRRPEQGEHLAATKTVAEQLVGEIVVIGHGASRGRESEEGILRQKWPNFRVDRNQAGPGCATPAQLNQRDAGEGGKVKPSSSRSHSAISASAISA